MKDYTDLLDQMNQALKEIQSFETENDKISFVEDNFELFFNFKNELSNMLRKYQFKESNNQYQNDICDKLKDNLIQILSVDNVFEYDSDEMSYLKYFKSNILDALSTNENKFAFRIQYEGSMNNTKSAILYLKYRDDYLKAIEDNNLLKDEDLTSYSSNSYINNHYEQNMLGHSLIQLNNNFKDLEKEDIIQLMSCIDSSSFINSLETHIGNSNFFDENLTQQYINTVLKLKSIFKPDDVLNDKFVQLFWNGKIQDSKTIQSITKNISIDNVSDLLLNSVENESIKLFSGFSKHFKSVGMSDDNISKFFSALISKDSLDKSIANFLAEIDMPENLEEFENGKHFEEYPWLLKGDTFDKIKDVEKKLDNARYPFLPCDYYIKKLNGTSTSNNFDTHFIQNLITLLHTEFYSEDEKNKLKDNLKESNLYIDYIDDTDITFEPNDNKMLTYKKAIQCYFAGKIIPNDISISIINNLVVNDAFQNKRLDKKLLEASVQSMMSNYLSEKEIDLGNRVFFGNGKLINRGYYTHLNKSIWIDDNLIDKFINSPDLSGKTDLFDTMFHEMQHAIQFKNIDKGNIDYLTYNFIKEEAIQNYDEDFYNNNYTSMYIESDARKQAILETLDFLKSVNPEFVQVIREKSEPKYIAETLQHTVYNDAEKEMQIGNKKVPINISDYLGNLIENNPTILKNYPQLAIEYNVDGTRKDIQSLLLDYSNKKDDKNINFSNTYSIYHGLITQAMSESEVSDVKLNEQVAEFLNEQPELISLEDMQNYYKNVPKDKINEFHRNVMLQFEDPKVKEVDLNDNHQR